MADERIHYYSMWRVYHPGDLREKKNTQNEQASSRQGEDSTSEESLVYKISQTKNLSARALLALSSHQRSAACPSPFHILRAVAANVGRKGDALSSLALMISIK